MRVLFLTLMIALTPLRVWVGDAMAIGSVSPSLVASQATHAGAPAAMTDCPGHDGSHETAAADPGQDLLHGSDDDCASCSSCQICHTVALAALLPRATAAAAPWATPQATLTRYASAERAPGFKPPIS